MGEGDDGRILIKCFVGCDLERILTPLSLKPSDLFKEQEHAPNFGKGAYKEIRKETAWDIVQANGTVVATHYRTDYSDGSKRYYWKRNDTLGLGGYKTARLPLYGLKYLNGQSEMCIITEGEKEKFVFVNGQVFRVKPVELTGKKKVRRREEGNLSSPISGKVVSVKVKNGDSVKKGEVLMIIEAMKMEYLIRAPYNGKIKNVNFKQNDQVEIGQSTVDVDKEV